MLVATNRCTLAFIRPGITYLPRASMTLAPEAPAANSSRPPIALMRVPSIRIERPSIGLSDTASMIVALVMRRDIVVPFCSCLAVTEHAHRTHREARSGLEERFVGSLFLDWCIRRSGQDGTRRQSLMVNDSSVLDDGIDAAI